MHLFRSTILTLSFIVSINLSAAVSMVGSTDIREAKIWYQLSDDEAKASHNISLKKVGDSKELTNAIYSSYTQNRYNLGNAVASNLLPDTKYEYAIKSADGKILTTGSFKTKPDFEGRKPAPDFSFVVFGGCWDNEQVFDPSFRTNGGEYEIFDVALKTSPAFAVWADGATQLRRADEDSKSGIFARYTHARNQKELSNFISNVSNYGVFSKNAVSTKSNISGKTKTNAIDAFTQFWNNPESPSDKSQYYTFEYSDTQFFILDDTSNRNTLDYKENRPSFLADEQLKWLFSALKASTAKFKIVVMNSPVLNPAKTEGNFTNAETERNALLDFCAEQKITGLIFISSGKPYGEITRLVSASSYPLFDVTAGSTTARPVESTDELNFFRVPNSGTFTRSFVKVDVSGTENSREIKFTFIDSKGNTGFSQTIKESELKYKD